MSKPTVRLYGLLPMTRARYLWQLSLALCLAAVILTLWLTRWPALRRDLTALSGDGVARVVWIGDAVPWVILAVAAVQLIEALIVLRLFARKEGQASGGP